MDPAIKQDARQVNTILHSGLIGGTVVRLHPLQCGSDNVTRIFLKFYEK